MKFYFFVFFAVTALLVFRDKPTIEILLSQIILGLVAILVEINEFREDMTKTASEGKQPEPLPRKDFR